MTITEDDVLEAKKRADEAFAEYNRQEAAKLRAIFAPLPPAPPEDDGEPTVREREVETELAHLEAVLREHRAFEWTPNTVAVHVPLLDHEPTEDAPYPGRLQRLRRELAELRDLRRLSARNERRRNAQVERSASESDAAE